MRLAADPRAPVEPSPGNYAKVAELAGRRQLRASRRTCAALAMLRNLGHAEPHADLQALDRLLDRAGERQAEARPIRLLQDDAHVLLRPGHAAAFGPGVHGPVLRAAVTQRLAQPLRVHAESPAEPQAFVVHRDARPKDEVVDDLRDLSTARRPQMENVRGKRAENGSAELEGLGVARAVDEELARRGGRLPARERDVEKDESPPREARRQPRRIAPRDRRAARDDEARPGALEHALLAEENLFDFAVKTDHDDDEVARLRCFARRGRTARTQRDRLLPRFLERVVADDLEALRDQMSRNRAPHLA